MQGCGKHDSKCPLLAIAKAVKVQIADPANRNQGVRGGGSWRDEGTIAKMDTQEGQTRQQRMTAVR